MCLRSTPEDCLEVSNTQWLGVGDGTELELTGASDTLTHRYLRRPSLHHRPHPLTPLMRDRNPFERLRAVEAGATGHGQGDAGSR